MNWGRGPRTDERPSTSSCGACENNNTSTPAAAPAQGLESPLGIPNVHLSREVRRPQRTLSGEKHVSHAFDVMPTHGQGMEGRIATRRMFCGVIRFFAYHPTSSGYKNDRWSPMCCDDAITTRGKAGPATTCNPDPLFWSVLRRIFTAAASFFSVRTYLGAVVCFPASVFGHVQSAKFASQICFAPPPLPGSKYREL